MLLQPVAPSPSRIAVGHMYGCMLLPFSAPVHSQARARKYIRVGFPHVVIVTVAV